MEKDMIHENYWPAIQYHLKYNEQDKNDLNAEAEETNSGRKVHTAVSSDKIVDSKN